MTPGVPAAGTPKTRAAGPPRTPKHPREEIVESPRIARLRRELDAGDDAALERFWAQAAAAGTPLLEDAEEGRCTVTFLWRDRHGHGEGTSRVVLVANRLTDPSVMDDSVLHRLAGTDVWHRSYRLASSFRATYLLAPEDGRVPADDFVWTGAAARWRGLVTAVSPDPLNPLAFAERDGASHSSIVALPDAPAGRVGGAAPGGRARDRQRAPPRQRDPRDAAPRLVLRARGRRHRPAARGARALRRRGVGRAPRRARSCSTT